MGLGKERKESHIVRNLGIKHAKGDIVIFAESDVSLTEKSISLPCFEKYALSVLVLRLWRESKKYK